MERLIPPFEEALFDPAINERTSIVNAAFDSVINDGILDAIPFFSLIKGTGKTINAIHSRHLLKQTLELIRAFNDKKLPAHKLEKYRSELKENPEKAEEELGRVLIILDTTTEQVQASLLGKAYRKYIDGRYTWSSFVIITEIIRRLIGDDLNMLCIVNSRKQVETKDINSFEKSSVDRLHSLGLVLKHNNLMSVGPNYAHSEFLVQVSQLGEVLLEIHYS